MASAFINDGWNLKSSIPEIPGVSPRYDFEYRLCKVGRRLKYSNAIRRGEDEQVKDGCALILEYVTEIIATNEDGIPERLDLKDMVTELHGMAWLTLIAHITGNVGPTPGSEAKK